MKSRSAVLLAGALAAAALTACQSTAEIMKTKQPQAVQTAVNRGKFEMSCPTATGTVISEDMLQPAVQGFAARGGPERAEFTVGVEGCGQRATYMVICPLNQDGCWSAGARNIIR